MTLLDIWNTVVFLVRLLCDLQDGPCKVIRVAVCGLGLSADRSLRAVGVRFRLLEPAIRPLPCGLAGVGSIGHGRNAPPDRQGDRSVSITPKVLLFFLMTFRFALKKKTLKKKTLKTNPRVFAFTLTVATI